MKLEKLQKEKAHTSAWLLKTANCLLNLRGINYIRNSESTRDFHCHRATKMVKNFALRLVTTNKQKRLSTQLHLVRENIILITNILKLVCQCRLSGEQTKHIAKGKSHDFWYHILISTVTNKKHALSIMK